MFHGRAFSPLFRIGCIAKGKRQRVGNCIELAKRKRKKLPTRTLNTILRASKQLLAGYGFGQYECSLTASGTEIVLVHTVFPCVHMKVTDNASNIKKAFKFFDD